MIIMAQKKAPAYLIQAKKQPMDHRTLNVDDLI